MSGFDPNGRPIQTPQPPGQPTYPGIQGGTNWYSPSYSPRTRLFYVTTWQDVGIVARNSSVMNSPGQGLVAGAGQNFVPSADNPSKPIVGAQQLPALTHGPINNWTEAAGHGAVLAIDPTTGAAKWEYRMGDVSDSGLLTTATDLAITGGREGYLQVLDARTGQLLWRINLGSLIRNSPITYAVNGKQYVSAIAGLSLFTFALPN
jgi:alcohol dehydrogenase (cytochrome c)